MILKVNFQKRGMGEEIDSYLNEFLDNKGPVKKCEILLNNSLGRAIFNGSILMTTR